MEKRIYLLVIKPLAEKKLNKLPAQVRATLMKAIDKLANDPDHRAAKNFEAMWDSTESVRATTESCIRLKTKF